MRAVPTRRERLQHLLHALWGKAAAVPNYDKREWSEFQQLIEDLERAAGLADDAPTNPGTPRPRRA